MKHATRDIIESLRSAREAAGLSQRALGERAGMPQSHISKIENGGADIRVSNLVALARALDLEPVLVPRKALPVVNEVARGLAPRNAATRTLRKMVRTLDAASKLRALYPALDSLDRLERGLQSIRLPGAAGKEPAALREIAGAVRDLDRLTASHGGPVMDSAFPVDLRQRLDRAAASADKLSRTLADTAWNRPPRPAYSLDDDLDD